MARAKRVCAEPDCPELVTRGRCTTHTREQDRQRGTRQQRGYDAAHDRLRRTWEPRVDLGRVQCHAHVCLMPARLIIPGTPWDLGHSDDRTTWTGPEHARCNRSAGARASRSHRA